MFSIITLIFLALTYTVHAQDEHIDNRLYTTTDNLVTYIGQQKFMTPGKTTLLETYTISVPGTYVLSENIISASKNSQIIYITSNNVLLDLGGKSITMATSPSLTNGIAIAANVSNVTIKNGLIANTTNNGIFINAGCSHIQLEDLSVMSCSLDGITFDGTAPNPITGCSISDCQVKKCTNTTATTVSGLSLTYCNHFTLEDSDFSLQSVSGATQNCYGVYALQCKNLNFVNCTANSNSSTQISAGFYLDTGCNCCTFTRCKAYLNASLGSTTTSNAYGFYEQQNNNIFYEKCSATGTTAWNLAAGYYVNQSNYSQWVECISQNNNNVGTSSTTGGYGFLANTATCTGLIFDKCVALGNTASSDITSRGCGFSLVNCSFCTIKNSYAYANNGGAGLGIGMNLSIGCNRCTLEHNIASTSTSITRGNAYGIYDEGASTATNLLIDNLCFGNRDSTATPTDKNYQTNYTVTNLIQKVAKTAVKTLATPSFLNNDITP